jgi:hypothetical protein
MRRLASSRCPEIHLATPAPSGPVMLPIRSMTRSASQPGLRRLNVGYWQRRHACSTPTATDGNGRVRLGRATPEAEGTLDLRFRYAFWAVVRIADRLGPDRAGQPVFCRGPLINQDTDRLLLGGEVVRGLSR